jgi:hypothetical protein
MRVRRRRVRPAIGSRYGVTRSGADGEWAWSPVGGRHRPGCYRAASLCVSIPPKYTRLMAMEYVVQRLEMGDVVLIDLPEQGGEVEAKVVEPIDRTKATVRVSLRVAGREDFVKEWPLGEKVTVVRGP